MKITALALALLLPAGVSNAQSSVADDRPPSVIKQVEPDYSEEARRLHLSGHVQVFVRVGIDGLPHRVKVIRGPGHGLDEKAVEAVRQYIFRPEIKGGKPVETDLYIDVEFKMFR